MQIHLLFTQVCPTCYTATRVLYVLVKVLFISVHVLNTYDINSYTSMCIYIYIIINTGNIRYLIETQIMKSRDILWNCYLQPPNS